MPAEKKDKKKGPPQEYAPIEALRLEANEQLLLLRKEPGASSFEFVAVLGEGENRLPVIQEKYGGGDYWVRTQKQDSGQWVPNKSTRVKVAGPPKVQAPPAGMPAGPAADALLWLKALGELMPKPGAAADPMAIAAAMAQANATSLAAVLGILTPLLTQQQQPRGGSADVGNVVAAVRDVVGLAKELQPEPAGGGDPIYRTIAAPLLQLLTKLADGAPRQRLQLVKPAAPPAAGADPAAAAAAPPAPAGASDVTHPLLPHIAPFLPELVRFAAAGKNVELYADVVLDNLPDDVYATLTGHLSDLIQVDALEAALVAADADVAAHRAWFHEFLRAVFDALHAPEDGAPAPEAAG